MRRRLHKRYGRSHGQLRWSVGADGSSHAITKDGRAVYVALHDKHKRKWTLLRNGEFFGSAIRRRDAQRIANEVER